MRTSKGQLRKIANERRFQLIQYLSYKPRSSCRPTWNFLKILSVSFKLFCLYRLIKKKKNMGTQSKDRKYFRDKASVGNPKEVIRGYPPLTVNRTLTDCVENTPGPSVQHIHSTGGQPYWGVQRYDIRQGYFFGTGLSNNRRHVHIHPRIPRELLMQLQQIKPFGYGI